MKDIHSISRTNEGKDPKKIPEVVFDLIRSPVQQTRIPTKTSELLSVDTLGKRMIVTLGADGVISVYDPTKIVEEGSYQGCRRLMQFNVTPPEKNDFAVEMRAILLSKSVVGCLDVEAKKNSLFCTFSAGRKHLVNPLGSPITAICKNCKNELAFGTSNGELIFFLHKGDPTTWKRLSKSRTKGRGHKGVVSHIAARGDIIVSTSSDKTAIVWNAATMEKKKTLYHNQSVFSVSISDEFIVTQMYSAGEEIPPSQRYKDELRVYNNDGVYGLRKIFHTDELRLPKVVDSGHILYLTDLGDEWGLAFLHIESEKIIGSVKIDSSRLKNVRDFALLPDGRVVIVGAGHDKGIIATIPEELQVHVASKR